VVHSYVSYGHKWNNCICCADGAAEMIFCAIVVESFNHVCNMEMSVMDIKDVLEILPHRYPMLLIDKVLKVDGDESIVALKNVTINEDFFNGHFPDTPVMPGVLIIESLAQAAILLIANGCEKDLFKKKNVYFAAIKNVSFKHRVSPGDTLHLHVKKMGYKLNTWQVWGEAYVDSQLVAKGMLSAALRDK